MAQPLPLFQAGVVDGALERRVVGGVAVEGDVQGADAGGLAGVDREGEGEAAFIIGVAPLRR